MSSDERIHEVTPASTDDRPLWQMPAMREFPIATHTAITNCGNGDDGIICQASG